MIGIVALILLMFVLMGFFAGSEMAFLSCNKLKLKHRADQHDHAARIIHRYQREPKFFLTAVLIGTNLAHVTLTSLFTYLMNKQFQITQEWLVTLILAPLVIIFAETVPKDWFRQKADDFIYRFAYLLRFFDRLFLPFSRSMLMITDFLIALTFPKIKRNPFVTKEEFRYVIDESSRTGVLLEHEKRLIHTILNLDMIHVQEVMTPLKEFPQLELSKKIGDVKEIARSTKKHIVLIYEEIPSLVVGIVHVFDVLFEDNPDEGLRRFLRPPLFIPQDMSAEKAILLLQSKRSSYAAVTDANQEVVGVVGVDHLIRF